MGSPAELTLGRPCNWAKLGSGVTDQLERVCKLEQYLTALEDERKKIEAFKRELPYCMQLLSDEIEASKEQLTDCLQPPLKSSLEGDPVSAKRRPILEEFMPLKSSARSSSCEDMEETTPRNYSSIGKFNGAVQAKFWSQAEAYAHGQEIVSSMTEKPFKRRDNFCTSEEQVSKPILNSQRRAGGAFLPFSRDRKPSYLADLTELQSPTFRDGEVSPSTELGRPSTSTDNEGANQPHHQIKEMQNAPAVSTNNSSGQGAPQRKPRRCWSPDLHRRFVNALQQLGGSEVATPKQIRELMKVEGLTNDEVKSHLQKYRLHTRRPNSGFHSAAPHAPQLVVLGGIWVPAHAAAAAVNQATPALYNSAQQDTPMFHQPPFVEDHYGQLNASTTQLQMHSSLYYDEQHGAATHSQGSSQGPVHLAGHSSDVGREESLGEDGNEGSSRKAGYQQDRLHESEDNGDNYAGSLHGHHRWRYARDTSGEEDSEAEDGRVYETVI